MDFKLHTPYQPTGDQPGAIAKLTDQFMDDSQYQTLLGVTGSGKTFTMANVIQNIQKPTLIIAHNKTLAAQLYQEFRDYFPENAVSYFVSYYDYYQPEAYIPSTDTYIEKEATINDEIDKLRLATTTNLLTRRDVIVVASVSCIYNLGSPVEYGKYMFRLVEGEIINRETLILRLTDLQYERSDHELRRGSFRIKGDVIQLWPAYEDKALKIDTLENKIESINWIDPVSGSVTTPPNSNHSYEAGSSVEQKKFVIYPAKHYLINPKSQQEGFAEIEHDLAQQLKSFEARGKMVEAYRLKQKVMYDLEMLREFGFVNGIENYSRYFDGRKPGDAPFTLIDYFSENAKIFDTGSFLTIVDESHITLPQIRGMHNGDQARKQNLIEYGFRLPSALDNRPLRFDEYLARIPQMLSVSATPNDLEISLSKNEVVEQVIRPTGLVDPEIEIRPTQTQIEDLIIEVISRKQKGQRSIVTTLTKKMAEALTEYLNDPEKIYSLLSNFTARTSAQADNPDKSINQPLSEVIPDLTIGPVAENLYTEANLPRNFTMSEQLLPKVAYLHSDIETLERSDILDDLRRGVYDVVVGINLLREGLDLPEVTLVAILDADKEGFLRSETSLVQTIGRAARHVEGRAILYADKLTKSMLAAISETYRRRDIQIEYNHTHNINPTTISKPIRDRMIEKSAEEEHNSQLQHGTGTNSQGQSQIIALDPRTEIDLYQISADTYTESELRVLIKKLTKRMNLAAAELEYELAAEIRDVINRLKSSSHLL